MTTKRDRDSLLDSHKCFVSVIIPTKNESRHLPRILACLASQTFTDYEIIVADNFSSDLTKEICRQNGIKVISGGLPGRGRNQGAKSAKAKFLLFLDADVTFDSYFIERALKTMQRLKADALSFGFRADTKNPFLRFVHKICKYYFHISQRLGFPHAIGGAILVKVGVHHKIGGFDERISVAEDHDYAIRLSGTFKYKFVGKPFVYLSTRRFYSEGVLRHCLKWIYIESYRILRGNMPLGKISYFKPANNIYNINVIPSRRINNVE